MERTEEKLTLEKVSPPWYLSILLGFGLGAAYLLSGLTWVWWQSGLAAWVLSRRMREALWGHWQRLNGWVGEEELTP